MVGATAPFCSFSTDRRSRLRSHRRVLEAVPNRREASPQRPRRHWSAEAKARLIEATLKPGVPRLDWRPRSCSSGGARAIKSGAVTPQRDADWLGFIEVTAAPSSTVEISLGDMVIQAGADDGNFYPQGKAQ
ncbi:hypothetical protein [Mesorhizobium sp. BHbdii]